MHHYVYILEVSKKKGLSEYYSWRIFVVSGLKWDKKDDLFFYNNIIQGAHLKRLKGNVVRIF